MGRTISLALALVVFLAGAALADALPKGWQSHKFNGPNQPEVTDGVVTFELHDRQCSDIKYGDGRGESDCLNGAVRSAINYQGNTGRLGETVTYRFDLWVDPSFDFASFRNPDAVDLLPAGVDSRLRIASWEGTYLHNFIYIMKADRQRGITFTGEQCQAPEDFGTWVSVAVTIKWANDERGWIRVTCDDRLVYVDEDVATNQAPHCYPANQCERGIPKDPRQFIFLLGPIVGGLGGDYADYGFLTPFIDIQPDGIRMKARNMSITQGGTLYSDDDRKLVAELQDLLNALGCDAGPADGIAGPKTKAAAMTCRDFGWDQPSKFTPATVPALIDLYENLEAGSAEGQEADTRFVLSGTHSEVVGNGDHAISVNGRVESLNGDAFDLSFLVLGRFDDSGVTRWLDVLLEDDLGQPIPEAVTDCGGVRTETWGDGSTHAVIKFSPTSGGFSAATGACLVEALPPGVSEEAAFILDRFREVAAAIALSTSLPHGGAQAFMAKAAAGDIAVGM